MGEGPDDAVRLSIWDHAGDPKFRSVVSHYFSEAEGIFLVYDVTNEDSFLNLKQWVDEIEQRVAIGSACVCILANKIDDSPKRVVNEQRARAYAYENGFQYLVTPIPSNFS